MNWKRLSSDFLLILGMQIAVVMLIFWKSFPNFRFHDFTSHEFTKYVVGAVAVSIGWVGRGILNRGRNRTVSRITPVGMVLSIVLLCMSIDLGGRATAWFYPLLALLAFPFPLALYLNRKQSKSTPQPTSANVS